MNRRTTTRAALPALAVAASLLAACSSSGTGSTSAAQARLAQISAATHPSASSSSSSASSAPAGPTIDLASVHTCALLSGADADTVARAEMLDEAQTATTVYAFTATPQPDAHGSSCEFRITPPAGDDGQGSMAVHVRSATGFVPPADGTPISGLGTEAYDSGDAPVVRVGTVLVTVDDDSFSDDTTVALLRRIVAKLT